jgi:hypothetical protein
MGAANLVVYSVCLGLNAYGSVGRSVPWLPSKEKKKKKKKKKKRGG